MAQALKELTTAACFLLRTLHAIIHFSPLIEVTLQPDPVNTTLGSIVNFKCNAVGDIVSWKVNGLSSKDPTIGETFEADVDTTPTGSNTYRSALNLRANREGITRIQCVAVSFFNVSAFSQEVTLLVQGTICFILTLKRTF